MHHDPDDERENGVASIQAGAGIVADSVPEKNGKRPAIKQGLC
ncbi:hypothetical protein PO124_16050 [Bacillus licheniformis]|nr:hypothetical protein [Bacillus licheniformis]